MVYKPNGYLLNTSASSRGVRLGPSRTLQQERRIWVLQIVDIALKAISPAVTILLRRYARDHLSRLLIRLISREMPEPLLLRSEGVARVSIRWIDLERLLDSAFEQIRMYSKTDVAVSMRLLRAFGDIACHHSRPNAQKDASWRAKRVVAGCQHRIDAEN